MAFEITTATRKMLKLKGRRKIIQGATSSGKTYVIVPIGYDKCIEKPRITATVVAETIPALKDGAVKIFKDFMYEERRWNDDCWIGNPMEYTLPNGSKLQFKSFDSVGKAKAAGKRDWLFINEANHIPYPIADALMIRSKETWLDFNADSEFWAHTEVLKQPNTDFLKLTYLDNEAIPKETLEDLMYRKGLAENEDKNNNRGYWYNWWQVYGLGEIGSLQGVVFNNWKQTDYIPDEARLLGYGMDFGYTNDPTTLISCYKHNEDVIFDEVIYQKGLMNNDIANLIKQEKQANIYADSAEPKSIDELRRYGIKAYPTAKGKDSILYGISLLQEKNILITKRSLNLIKELRNYTWAVDKEGNKLNKPIDAFNHGIDAMRYLAVMEFKNSKRFSRAIV